MRFGKSEAAGKKGKRIIEALVRERRGGHEKKLEVARLRENLVHEEFQVNVHDVYNFRYVQSRFVYCSVARIAQSSPNADGTKLQDFRAGSTSQLVKHRA